MTEFETELLSLLRDIRDELQVSSMPEDLRRNQREVIDITKHLSTLDRLKEMNEDRITNYLDELIKHHPEKEYDELLIIDEKLQLLDQRNKELDLRWEQGEKRLETLCKRGCFHPEYIYS